MNRSSRSLLGAVLVVLVAGCGGSNDSGSTATTDPTFTCSGATNGTMTATVNGAAWAACGTISISNTSSVSGKDTLHALAFQGTGVIGTAVWVINVSIVNGKGLLIPGGYAVGTANPTAAAFIVAGGTNSNSGWSATATGGSGSVVVTSASGNRISGTFSADPIPTLAGTTGAAQIRNGKFDLTF